MKYYKYENAKVLDCYVDSDWAGDNIDRKSTTGYVIRMFGNVFWKSRKQSSVTKASTYAEYVALSDAVSEVKFLIDVMKIFDLNFDEPIVMYEDNSGALSIAKYGNFTKNSKHIEVHYHFVNELYMSGLIDIVKVNTDDNLADIFTKVLCKDKFVYFRNIMNIN